MERTTKYDIVAKEAGVFNKEDFIENLKRLSTVNENANKLFEELSEMQRVKVDIPKDLSKEEFLAQEFQYYNCMNICMIDSTYAIILEKFGYIRDETANLMNTKPAIDAIYRAYREDYNKFIECMHIWMEDPSIWSIPFQYIDDPVEPLTDIPEPPHFPF